VGSIADSLRFDYRSRLIARRRSNQGKGFARHNFEGVIFTPALLREYSDGSSPYGISDTWTPTPELIIEAEKALPKAISKVIVSKQRRINFPAFYTAKNGTNLAMGDETPNLVPDQGGDSDFVPHMAFYLSKFKRQYIGLTVRGRKVLVLNFFPDSSTFSDPKYLSDWNYRWVDVLDGGWSFWRVIYDPTTQKFSDWQCNGEA
jgi:hypothetical protein